MLYLKSEKPKQEIVDVMAAECIKKDKALTELYKSDPEWQAIISKIVKDSESTVSVDRMPGTDALLSDDSISGVPKQPSDSIVNSVKPNNQPDLISDDSTKSPKGPSTGESGESGWSGWSGWPFY